MSEIKQSLDVINNEAAALYEEIRRDMDERGVQLKLEPIKNEDYEYAQSKILTSERKESYKKKIVDYTADYIEKNAQVEKEYDAITAKMKDVKDTYIAEQYINIQEAYTAIIRELEMTERFLQNIQGELDITNTNFDAIDTFIKKFQPLLDEANEKMEVISPKKTGEKCPECGHDLVERHGRYGKFIACENYHECKYIKKEKVEPEFTGENCPKCGSPMVFKTGRYGKFEACSNYPQCKYIKNSKKKAEPVMTDEVCPNCGSPVVIKKGRWGEFKACSNYPKCKTIIK